MLINLLSFFDLLFMIPFGTKKSTKYKHNCNLFYTQAIFLFLSFYHYCVLLFYPLFSCLRFTLSIFLCVQFSCTINFSTYTSSYCLLSFLQVLCILHFIYSSVCMLIPSSRFIPSHDVSPLVTISLFSISVRLCFVSKFVCII